jgi:RHS repeat-associated protein
MVDAAGTTVYGYSAGGQLWTEDGPFDSDTVTNTYQNRLRVALSLGQPTGAWTNAFPIYVTDDSSDNPANWGAPVATGEWFWPNLQARREVYFTPKSGRFVYFRRTTAWGWYRTQGYPGFASANEIWVYEQSGGWELASETRYIYDGKRVIQVRNSANTPAVSYTRGTDLSGSLEGAGGIGGLLARSTLNPQLSTAFYHSDGNGNVTALVDSNQELAASYRYDPFGNLISQSGALAAANVYRFSSKEHHLSSGLYYYLYRFYSPTLQRWVNRDPINELGFSNFRIRSRDRGAPRRSEEKITYAFVANDPLNSHDPLGLFIADFKVYGNYCGPGWCDGKKQSEADCAKCPRKTLSPPIDAMDTCCRRHDLYIGVGGDAAKADAAMCECLKKINPEDITPPAGMTENQVSLILSAMLGTFCHLKPHE